MHSLHRYTVSLIGIAFLIFSFSACKKETSDVIYELEQISALPPSAGKIKLKSEEQFVAVLYANLFQKAISVSELKQITDAIYSVGDKQLAYEMVVSNFMNRDGLVLPNDSILKFGTEEEIGTFMNETYERFYVRSVSEAEKLWFIQYIRENKDTELSIELVYAAFALSNEYQFY